MDKLKNFFPLSAQCTDSETLIKNIIIYLVAGIIGGLVCKLVGIIPLVGGIIGGILGVVVGLYVFVGLVLAILIYFNVVK